MLKEFHQLPSFQKRCSAVLLNPTFFQSPTVRIVIFSTVLQNSLQQMILSIGTSSHSTLVKPLNPYRKRLTWPRKSMGQHLHLHLHVDRNGNGNEIVSSHQLPPSSAGAMFPSPLDIPARERSSSTPLLNSEKRGAMPAPTYSSGQAGEAPSLAILCAKVTFITQLRPFFNSESSGRVFIKKGSILWRLDTSRRSLRNIRCTEAFNHR